MSPTVTLISHESELHAYLDLWRQWATTPMQTPEWMLSWWKHQQTPACQLAVGLVHDQDRRPIGLMPTFLRDNWMLGRSLRFLGSGKACSDFQTVLSAPGREAEVGQAVAKWLTDSRKQLSWSLIELEGTCEKDAKVSDVVSQLCAAGCWSYQVQLENTWRVNLTGGWQGFLKGMSKTQARQTRNLFNRYDRSQSMNVRSVSNLQDLPAAYATFIDLHQRRWNAIGKPGSFATQSFRRFVLSACQELCRLESVSIAILEDAGVPVAAHLYLLDVKNKGAYLYQTGRAPERDRDRVGRILNAVCVRNACEQGLNFLDYLRGDEGYKDRLGAKPSVCLRTRVVAPAILPKIRSGTWELGRELRERFMDPRKSHRPDDEITSV